MIDYIEVGRLPNNVASWVSKLIDMRIISIQGTVIECPKPLRTGNNIVLSLRAYMTPTAFETSLVKSSNEDGSNRKPFMWGEGAETVDELILRERKESLMQLFKAVNLKPVRSGAASRTWVTPEDQLAHGGTVPHIKKEDSKGKGKAKAVEIIGDDEDAEEVEVEGEELTDNQLSSIYIK